MENMDNKRLRKKAKSEVPEKKKKRSPKKSFGFVRTTKPRENSEEVLKTWDEAKRIEKDQRTVVNTMEGGAETLPALWRAEKIQKKASVTGIDSDDVLCSLDRLKNNMDALGDTVNSSSHTALEERLGEVLFAAVSIARKCGIDAEMALHHECEKQIKIFRFMEENYGLKDMKYESLDSYEITELYTTAKEKIGL